jgi:hypothetical protein
MLPTPAVLKLLFAPLEVRYDADMRITWLCVRVGLLTVLATTGCHGSKGGASSRGSSGGQAGTGIPVTQGSEGGTSNSGGTSGGSTGSTGGTTGRNATTSGGTTGAGTSASSSGGGMSVGGVISGPPVAAENFVDQWAAAVCDSVQPCCQASKYGWDRQGCLSKMASLVSAQASAASTAGVTWDAAAAGKCIAGTKRDYAGCNPPLDFELDELCRSVLVASKQTGETCTSSIQCMSTTNGQGACGSVRVDAGTGTRQVCTVRSTTYARAKQGEPCNNDCKYIAKDSVRCYGNDRPAGDGGAGGPVLLANCFENDGLHCDETTGRCIARLPAGSPCKDSFDCAAGLACVSGKCASPPALGVTCTLGSGCVAGLYCDDRKFVCMEGLPDGASCDATSHCQSGTCLCTSVSQSNCVCGPQIRWGAVSDVQCTGQTKISGNDGGTPALN